MSWRRTLRLIAALCSVFMIAAACSRPADRASSARPERVEVDPEVVDPEGDVVEDPAVGSGDGSDGAGRATSEAQDAARRRIENPDADQEQIRLVGSQVKPQSTDFPNGNPATWQGVSRKEILLAPGYDKESCGADTVALISAAGGALPTSKRFYRRAPRTNSETAADTEESIQALMTYFNGTAWEGFEQYPQLVPLRDKFGTPEFPFYGRKLRAETVDIGSFQCPEKQTDAAIKIGNEMKAFAAFSDRWDGTPTNLASRLNAKVPADRRPMMFGTLWLPDNYYRSWAPFVWTQFSSGTTITRQFASYICSRVVGKNASNSAQYAETPRKFGLLYPNRQEDRDRVKEFKVFVEQFCGKPFNEVVALEKEYTFDLGRAQDEGQQIAIQWRGQGITSAIYLSDPVMPFFQQIQWESQGWRPEILVSSVGYADSNTVGRLWDKDKRMFGVSQLGVYGGWGYGAGDPFTAYHYSHRKSPNTGRECDPSSDEGMNHDENYCKAPTAIVTLYYSFLPLIGGMYFAGPDLTPHNVSRGLQNYPKTRYGGNGPTSDPRPALVGAGPDQYHFIVDAVEFRYRAGYKSPYPEHQDGWLEYPDCMRHYMQWPDQMATNWERDGPNFNAWCGDPKYAPADSPEKDGYPRITEGTNPS